MRIYNLNKVHWIKVKEFTRLLTSEWIQGNGYTPEEFLNTRIKIHTNI